MQYHGNGFRAGDPRIAPAADNLPDYGGAMPDEVDVLIVGCGPAGLTLAAQMAAFPDINTRIIDRRSGPLERGQADGVACRSMEMFEAFGFSEFVAREAYWVNETSFWQPGPAGADGTGSIIRAKRIQDVEDGLSEFPHTILNQARIHDLFLDCMRRAPRRLVPDYNRSFVDLVVNRDDPYPVTVTLCHHGDDGDRMETLRARYVVGCDGARSQVRAALGYSLYGDSANKLWGVMDVLAITDFPDVRLKCAIQSASEGSMLIIPREGGYMARMYIEMDKLAENERVADRNITPDQLVAAAARILHPYRLDVKEIAWWSAYEIGQRLCDSFDDVSDDDPAGTPPHVFIAGDACHTHSPKAGQGMNVSMADSFNLGWKLAAVLNGHAAPHLLHSYSQERRAKAQELIDFDREIATLFSARQSATGTDQAGTPEAAKFQAYFAKHGRYTAGVETQYAPSLITRPATDQYLATGFAVGKRFHSAPVIRLADARPLHLAHTIKADGRWRLFAFASRDDDGAPDGAIAGLCDFLQNDDQSPLRAHTPTDADIDALIDLRAIFQQPHRDLRVEIMPSLLKPQKGRLGLIDYEKIFCPDFASGADIFDLRGIDRDSGCLVVVRPDQYVADVLPVASVDRLAAFFAGFMTRC